MKQCTACRRHVRPAEGSCPFCGETLRTTGPARVGAALLLGALGAACASRPVDETATGGATTSSSTSSSSGDPSATAPLTTTTGPDGTTSTSSATATSVDLTTGELTTTNDVDTTDPGCSFYGGCPSDVANPNECDPWQQDCPPGQKCMPWSSDGDQFWDALKCVPVADNPGQLGDPCTVEGSGVSGIDDCALGHMCWNVDPDTLQGECIAMCTGTPDDPVCAAGSTCAIANDDVLTVCLQTCSPLEQDCGANEVCHIVEEWGGPVCLPDQSGDEGQEFDPCTFITACDPGLVCMDAALAVECDQLLSCCLPFCDTDAPACTGQGQECVPWMGMVPPGLENVGVCQLPP